jgi:hypothetical protein
VCTFDNPFKAYGLELNLTYGPGRNLRFNSSFNFYKAITKGSYNQIDFSRSSYSWTNRSSLAIKSFCTDIQATLNFHASRITPQGKDLSVCYADLGISREVFKGKGTLAFNIRDVFNSRKRRSIKDSEGLYSRSENQFHPRQFFLTLTFRFNKEANGKGEEVREENGNNPEV